MTGQAHVVLNLDTSRFEAALRNLTQAFNRFTHTAAWAHIQHQDQHHRPETPARSAMHTAYDHRRRARRRGKR